MRDRMTTTAPTLREERLPDLDKLARIYRLAPIGGVGYALLTDSLPRYPIDWGAWEFMQDIHSHDPAYRLDDAAVGLKVDR